MDARCCCWLRNQQPCSAWEPLHFSPCIFLFTVVTQTLLLAVLWAGRKITCLKKLTLQKIFSSEAVSWPGSWSSCTKDCVIAREGKDKVQTWWGRGCCFLHWCWIMLAYCVCLLLCAQSNPPQTRTDSVFQKNLTSFSKNSTFKLYFVTQNS